MGTKASTWVGGAVVAAVVMLVAAWFLVISPIRATASTASSDADAAETHNAALQSQLTVLKKQFSHLEEYQAQLDELQQQIPQTAQLDGYIRTLEDYADKAEVVIIGTTPGTPVAVVPQVPEEVQKQLDDAAAAAKGDKGGDAATPDSTATAAPSAGDEPSTASAAQPSLPKEFEPIPGFVAIPIDVTVLGNADATFRFMKAMQDGKRPFLVTAFEAAGQDEQAAQNGRPATHIGDAETKITGYIYVLQDPATAPAEPTDPDAEEPAKPVLPKPKGDADPYTAT